MRLKFDLEFTKLGDEIVAVPSEDNTEDFCGIIKLNESAKSILELLAKNKTANEIIETLSKENPDTPKSEIESYVNDFVNELKDNGLLID